MTATASSDLPAAFERYRDAIEAELARAVGSSALPLYEMVRYHFGWLGASGGPGPGRTGKGLRPTLCLLVSDALAGAHERALPAAAAVELVHNFSLVHDDIQDDDDERHHRPTVWSVFGKAQAINAGTAMYALASLALTRLDTVGVDPERQLAALRLTHASCLRLLEGQVLDIAFEDRMDITVEDYLAMVRGKTAALLACSASLGALLAGDGSAPGRDRDVADRFAAWGENLGLAFQIRDDVLGIWGDPDRTGKPVGADIAARKKSLPVVDALARARGTQRKALHEVYAADVDDAGRDTVVGILDDLGTRERAMQLAESHRDRALELLDSLPVDPEARTDLEAIAHFLTERDR
ncbi:MAG: polyprenyl synthetase family protein [Deinococcales bacterium]